MARTKYRKTKITLGVILILLLAAGILLKMRWSAWFANSPESPYTVSDTISRITLVPGQDFCTERTVSWLCGKTPRSATVMLRLEGDSLRADAWHTIPVSSEVVTTRAGVGAYYHADLTALEAGHTYDVRLEVDHIPPKTIKVAMPHALDSVMHFVYLGDVQDPTGALSTELFSRFTSDTTAIRPDFFALAGDQLEGPTDDYWRVWYDSWQGYTSEMPMIVATGNHEYLKKGFARELDPRWIHQYHYPANGPKGFLRRSYYIDFPLARFVVMDSNGINSPTDVWRHRSWLREVLSTSTQPWQIVMFHHAVHCVRARRSHPIMQYIFKPILVEYGADLVLQGHDHAYSRITTAAQGGGRTTPVYIISCSSPKQYRNGFADIHERLGSGLQLYQTLRVTPDSIAYTSAQYSGEVYDALVLSRDAASGRITVTDMARDLPELFLYDDFSTSKKGQKKAQAYAEAVSRRLSQRR